MDKLRWPWVLEGEELNPQAVQDNFEGLSASLRNFELPNSTWIKPTLSGWIHHVTFPVEYRIFNGVVFFRGRVSTPLGTSGSTMFTLPVGKRPGSTQVFPAATEPFGSSYNPAAVLVSDVGVVSPAHAAVTSITFDGISFIAEN